MICCKLTESGALLQMLTWILTTMINIKEGICKAKREVCLAHNCSYLIFPLKIFADIFRPQRLKMNIWTMSWSHLESNELLVLVHWAWRRTDENSWELSSVQFSSVIQLCLTLCDPMNCSTPGLLVHHQLPEFAQTHLVGDAIQPSHPLLSPSPPAPNPSQHQGLFKWVSSLHQIAKVLEFQLQHQSVQWTPRTDLL